MFNREIECFLPVMENRIINSITHPVGLCIEDPNQRDEASKETNSLKYKRKKIRLASASSERSCDYLLYINLPNG
jgi:hypothetical protein